MIPMLTGLSLSALLLLTLGIRYYFSAVLSTLLEDILDRVSEGIAIGLTILIIYHLN